MKTTHFSPKILPWLASKAGITLHRAETLWQVALQHAETVTGETDTPAFWRAAMDCLLEQVAAESLREDAASFGWRNWTRLNKRLWQSPLQVIDALALNVTRGWRQMQQIQFG
jgi:hypothetical protein